MLAIKLTKEEKIYRLFLLDRIDKEMDRIGFVAIATEPEALTNPDTERAKCLPGFLQSYMDFSGSEWWALTTERKDPTKKKWERMISLNSMLDSLDLVYSTPTGLDLENITEEMHTLGWLKKSQDGLVFGELGCPTLR